MTALLDRFRKKKNYSVVVGIDGLPYSLIRKFASDGVMPYLGSLAGAGNLTRMKVTLPEISSVSWASFMTGANPGTHGIFGFTDLKPGAYDMIFPAFRDLKCPTFWDRLGESGKRSVIINQPGTYPAKPIQGVLVSGFVAIELVKAVYPPSWIGKLKRMNYQIDINTQLCRKSRRQLFIDLERTTKGRREAFSAIWEQEQWDYFQVVITGTDRIQHYVWSAIEDKSHPNHDEVISYYNSVDSFIKHAHEKYLAQTGESGPGKAFFLLSDHGFCGIKQEVYLSAWLAKEGYLRFSTPDPKGVPDISDDTKVFAMDPGRFYVHRKGKYPRGSVEENEARNIIEGLKSKLLNIEYEGKKIVQAVWRPEEIYSGPQIKYAPDLVATPVDGFDLKASVTGADIFRRTDLEGMHTWDDAFFWSEAPQPENLNITMLADIVTAPLKR